MPSATTRSILVRGRCRRTGMTDQAPAPGVGTSQPKEERATLEAAAPPRSSRLWERLRYHKVAQWTLAYAAAAYTTLHAVEMVSGALGWPHVIVRIVTLVLLLGVPVAVTLAWFHGHRAQQRAGPVEIAILTLLLLLAGAILWGLGRPAPELEQSTAARLRADSGGLPEVSFGPAAASIAVLPFDNRSRLEDDAYFVEGIHDDILTQLSKLSSVKVTSRVSVEQFRDTRLSARAIGERLGVANIVEGGVQRAGDRIRVTVQLIDAQSDSHLWAESYDRELTVANVFAIQTEIAAAIAAALKVKLSARDQSALSRMPTDSLAAYQSYLLGKHRMGARTSAGIAAAAEYFKQAVELDPDFAQAHVGLAETMILASEYGSQSRTELAGAAMPLLERALALDDHLSSAHTAIGAVRSKSSDTAGAEAAFRRAIELDHNNAVAFHWYADVLLLNRSQPESALALIQRAVELDPLSPAVIATLGQVLEALGRFDEARSQYESILEIDAASPVGYFLIGNFERFVNGRLDEAVRWYRESIARDPGNAAVQGSISISYLELGDLQQTALWMDRAMAQNPHQYMPVAAGMLLAARLHRESDSLARASRLREIWRMDGLSLAVSAYLGDYQTILDVGADLYPELSCSAETGVSRRNIGQAINLSLARMEHGERECAARLLEGVLSVTSRMPRMGRFGFGITDVEAQSSLGRTDAALATLRQAIDAGWRFSWGLPVELRPQLAALRNEPEFAAMTAEIERDMSIQLARVRQMEAAGQLAAIPER